MPHAIQIFRNTHKLKKIKILVNLAKPPRSKITSDILKCVSLILNNFVLIFFWFQIVRTLKHFLDLFINKVFLPNLIIYMWRDIPCGILAALGALLTLNLSIIAVRHSAIFLHSSLTRFCQSFLNKISLSLSIYQYLYFLYHLVFP